MNIFVQEFQSDEPAEPESSALTATPSLPQEFENAAGISFGGTAVRIAIVHDERVETKRWISKGNFFHALGFA